MSSSPATASSPPAEHPRRERRWIIGLIVMVVAIVAFTAVAITIELASNRGRVFRATVDVVGPVAGRALAPASPRRSAGGGRPDLGDHVVDGQPEAALQDRREVALEPARHPRREGRQHDPVVAGAGLELG